MAEATATETALVPASGQLPALLGGGTLILSIPRNTQLFFSKNLVYLKYMNEYKLCWAKYSISSISIQSISVIPVSSS